MKRAMLLVLMCMVFSVTVVSVSASAGEGKRRVYEGTLSSGLPIGMKLLVREDRPPGIAELEFGADMTCVGHVTGDGIRVTMTGCSS